MDEAKKKRLEEKGWHTGTVAEFLGLTPMEDALIALEVDAARFIRDRRKALGLTQADLAKRIGSTQSRVAKLENVADGITLDLYLRALVAVGGRLQVVEAEEAAPAAAPAKEATKRTPAARRESAPAPAPAGKVAAKGRARVAVRAKGK